MRPVRLFVAALALSAFACDDGDYLTTPGSGELAEAAVPGSGRPFSTVLTGAEEVPGPGDPDGSGTAVIRLNQGTATVCWEITWENINGATAAHIHRGAAGVAGPVVVPLDPNAPGCATGVDTELIKEIRKSPESFYVNVHNSEFPAGAIRGQLAN